MISVIIPVYNVIGTLRECVESVTGQSFKDVEILLVDDGSTDGSGRLADCIAAEDERVQAFHKENGGLSDARNYGLDRCHGEIVTFLDSDDMLGGNTLEPLASIMTEHPEYDILEYPALVHATHSTEYLFKLSPEVYSSPMEWWRDTDGYEHTWAWNKLYRRRVFAASGYPPQALRYPVGRVFEDVWMVGQILSRTGKIAVTDVGCYIYRWNPEGITCNASMKENQDLLEAHIELCRLAGINMEHEEWHRYYMAMLDIQIVLAGCGGPILMKKQKVRLKKCSGWKSKVKALLLNTVGLERTCRLFARKYKA